MVKELLNHKNQWKTNKNTDIYQCKRKTPKLKNLKQLKSKEGGEINLLQNSEHLFSFI